MRLIEKLTRIRLSDPEAVTRALEHRVPGTSPIDGVPLMVIAADHPARGAMGAGDDPLAMASRESLLRRCLTALSRPGVNGFLGTPDMVEDLALLGALDGKLVWGSMNRAGLQGSRYEIDDRMTAYDARGVVESGLDGGKLLVRIDTNDPATPAMLERAGQAVSSLAVTKKNALVEPFISEVHEGRVVNDLSPDAVIRSIAIASALGNTSARTWLKLPCVPEMERVMEATTLPSLLLGGEVPEDADTALAGWRSALQLPNVVGLVIGRALLFPRDGDVAAAVDKCVEVL